MIIYEDEYILGVSKPNNMLVHHAYHSRNVSDESSLLEQVLLHTGLKVYPIHRLDRKTSGIILLAKQKEFVSKFQDLFTEKKIKKRYYGVVRGFSPLNQTITTPVKGRDAKIHKEAWTDLKTLENITLDIPVKPYDTSRYSLVEMYPKTGRIHQLRIHTNKISHPLIGDSKYGDKNHDIMFKDNFGFQNLFLHAGKLEFIHPFTLDEMILIAPFPKDWNLLFEKFSWKNPLQ